MRLFLQVCYGSIGALLGGGAVLLLLAAVVDPAWIDVRAGGPYTMPAIWLCTVFVFSGILAGEWAALSMSGFFEEGKL